METLEGEWRGEIYHEVRGLGTRNEKMKEEIGGTHFTVLHFIVFINVCTPNIVSSVRFKGR